MVKIVKSTGRQSIEKTVYVIGYLEIYAQWYVFFIWKKSYCIVKHFLS